MKKLKLFFILCFVVQNLVNAQDAPCFPDTTVYCQGTTAISMAVANFNADVYKDIVAINQNGGYSILLNNGDGTFTTTDYAGSTTQSYVSAGDVDGDSKQDFVVAAGTSIDLYKGNGDGTFVLVPAFVTLSSPARVVQLDRTGPTNPLDMVILEPALQQVEYFVNNGGTGVFYSLGTCPVGSNPVALITGKFHTGTAGGFDIVVANAGDNTITVLYYNPGPMPFATDTTFVTDANPYFLSKGNFNPSDIHTDIAVANFSGNSVSLLIANGNNGFLPFVSYPVGANPTEISTGHFNNDPYLDIVSVSLASNTVSVLMGRSDSTFGPATNYAVNGNGVCVCAADFDYDFISDDIVVGHLGSAGVTVLTNQIPVPGIAVPASPVCPNEMIMFSSVGPYIFNWSGGISSGVWFPAPDSGSFSYQLVTTDTLTGCSVVDSFLYVVDQCLGLTDNSVSVSILVKPNPATDHIEISELFPGDEITICDFSGRAIYACKAESTLITIDTRGFATGLYFLKRIHQGIQSHGRLIISQQ